MDFVELEEAKQRRGMRMVTVAGLPSPWSEAAKGIFRIGEIPCVGVRLTPGDASVPEWTGVANAPAVVWDDEPARSGWAEILLLAERVASKPRLIPTDPEQRALLFGYAHEICGEMGLGWARRLDGVHQSIESQGERGWPLPVAHYLGGRYGYRPGEGDACRRRVVEVLGLLARRLHAQRGAGSGYYLGTSISALDVYSATFMTLVQPLPPEQCPIPEAFRKLMSQLDEPTRAALDPILLEHRDRIYRDYLELPVTL